MVIEERGLVFPPRTAAVKRDIYDRYYSVQRLRRLSEKRYLADHRRHDLWLALLATFRLFEAGGPGRQARPRPARRRSLRLPKPSRHLAGCTLGNDVLLGCLRSLSLYEAPGQPAAHPRQLRRAQRGGVRLGLRGAARIQARFHLNHGTNVEFAFEQGRMNAPRPVRTTPRTIWSSRSSSTRSTT